MPTGRCPRCKEERNLEVTVSHREVTGPDGAKRVLVTRTYHCEACGTFVRSEDCEQDPGEGGE
jgi:hypothetical protein